jgi:hypothetical protein
MGTEAIDYTQSASETTIDRVAAALTANNIEAVVVEDGDEARVAVLERIPDGAEVHTGSSKTLEDTGLFADLNESGRYNALRPRYMKMDRKTQGDEIRKLIAAPDHMVGSVQALTEDGILVVVSYAGSQIGPYAAGAGKVLLVVGSQKIVPDFNAAMARIEDHVFPYEDARLRERLGVGTRIAKVLQIRLEPRPGRTTVFLVRQPVGV